jgi:hypothetical protein
MSLLNLNSPQGRSPRGKQSSRVWMGFGLIIAVLGLGSTFAATININNNDTSEFGQGVTQTVFCGDSADVPTVITVTPISAFVNSVDTPTWRPPVFENKQWRDVGIASFSTLNVRSFTDSYVNDATGVAETQIGYWVKDRISTDYYVRSLSPILSGGGPYPPTGDYDTFVPQEQKNGRYGFYYYESWTPGFTADTTEDKFEFGGVKISDIPDECDGRDFVLSAYGSDAEPLELSNDLDVTEVAVNYESGNTEPSFSFDRTTPGANSGAADKVTVSADNGSIRVLFTAEAGRPLADSVTKVVVETQAASID